MALQLPKLIAHRGASAYAPENTLAAFKRAHQLGAAWVEFDVMLTKDKQVVVIHDATLIRTTNGHGRVRNKFYKDLKTLDAGGWFAPEFANEHIPTLHQVLRCCADLGLAMNIEIKPSKGQEIDTVDKVLNQLSDDWSSHLPDLLISSYSIAVLSAVRQRNKKVALAMVVNRIPRYWRRWLKEFQLTSINPYYRFVTQAKVKRLLNARLKVIPYTVNRKEIANKLFDWGVNAIFTDDPLLLN